MLIRLSQEDFDTCWNYAKKITKHRPDHPTYATRYSRAAWEDEVRELEAALPDPPPQHTPVRSTPLTVQPPKEARRG